MGARIRHIPLETVIPVVPIERKAERTCLLQLFQPSLDPHCLQKLGLCDRAMALDVRHALQCRLPEGVKVHPHAQVAGAGRI